MSHPKRLDEKGRCCGRKPLVYKRPPRLFCPRCDAEFDPDSGKQVSNWAYRSLAVAPDHPATAEADAIERRAERFAREG